jgi:polyisoprenoid-binding protein YceI
MVRRSALPALALLWPLAGLADPVPYRLDPSGSTVAFAVAFGADDITGSMPVAGAEITIDFDDVTASRVAVSLDASGARASFPFATEALTGERVLATASHPVIRYETDSVRREAATVAILDGRITIRGVTRPLSLRAEIYRATGSEPGDMTDLVILLTGVVNRSDFGADGWLDMVDDQVRLQVTAAITRN